MQSVFVCVMWKKCFIMQGHVEEIKKTHLRDLMADAERCKSMMVYDSFSIGLIVYIKSVKHEP